MTFDETKTKADLYFEFPTKNKDHVTTTSAVLFAMECSKEFEKHIVELETAIIKTLNKNGHLADGDNCTLRDLVRVMPDWDLGEE